MKPSFKNLVGFSFYSLTEFPVSARTEFYLPANPLGKFSEWGEPAVAEANEILKSKKVILFQTQVNPGRVFPYGVENNDLLTCWYYYGMALVAPGKGFKIAQWHSPNDQREKAVLEARIERIGDAAIWYKWGEEVTVTNIKNGITRV